MMVETADSPLLYQSKKKNLDNAQILVRTM